MRHPDCGKLEKLLGPGWACSGDWAATSGIGAAWDEAERLFTVDREIDDYGGRIYLVCDEESIIPTIGPLTTLADVALALNHYVAAYCTPTAE